MYGRCPYAGFVCDTTYSGVLRAIASITPRCMISNVEERARQTSPLWQEEMPLIDWMRHMQIHKVAQLCHPAEAPAITPNSSLLSPHSSFPYPIPIPRIYSSVISGMVAMHISVVSAFTAPAYSGRLRCSCASCVMLVATGVISAI